MWPRDSERHPLRPMQNGTELSRSVTNTNPSESRYFSSDGLADYQPGTTATVQRPRHSESKVPPYHFFAADLTGEVLTRGCNLLVVVLAGSVSYTHLTLPTKA